MIVIMTLICAETSCIAQLTVQKAIIEVSGIQTKDFYSELPPNNMWVNSTTITNDSFYLNSLHRPLVILETVFYADTTIIDSESTYSFYIDTIGKQISNLNAFNGSYFFDVSNVTGITKRNSVSIDSIPYQISPKGDTLVAILDAKNLKKHKFSIINSSTWQRPRDQIFFESNTMLGIDTNAIFKITLIFGNSSLSVISSKSDSKYLIVNLDTKKIKILVSKPNYSLPCFDLLGRKHNLEFLGTDGSASTYSVRSLPAGVYFVNDGKEMVKFLITE